ncbi:hypothetical protein [Maricaulis sp.]|uniref:hypothetical protein n=1 Tax=Maricaulis sp. TaxID=1486257 RepID=UPI000C358969|nr:hypothetical protein [Maricaulis sp.]MAC89383.1 hypothetical protein [Maricaulis sp.]
MRNIIKLYNVRTADRHWNKPEYEVFLKSLGEACFDQLRYIQWRGDKYLLDGEEVMRIEETSCGAEMLLSDPFASSIDEAKSTSLFATIDGGASVPLGKIREHFQSVEDSWLVRKYA